MMIKAVAYYRVASPDGVEMGLQRQKETVREYAKKNGYEIVAEVEAVESGSTADRDSLKEVKRELDNTGSEAVLVRAIDRLIRNPLEIRKVVDSFGGADIVVVEGIKYEDGILKKPDWLRQKEEEMDEYFLKLDVEKCYRKMKKENKGE